MRSFYLICAALLMILPIHRVLAKEDAIEEIVVTAQKREQSLQDVALSVSALTGDVIDKRGLEGFRDWADYVPGITMFQGQDSNRRMGPTATIRGVSHVSKGQLYEGTSTATTSFAVGQVPFFNGDPFLYDLNRIEVLRGPQGTLFGISSMGGTVRFIPNPARTDAFSAEIGAGSGFIVDGGIKYNVEGMVNIPLIDDKLAMRLSAKHLHNDGFIDLYMPPLDQVDPFIVNYPGVDPRREDSEHTVKDSNEMETVGARLALTFTPNDRSSIMSYTTWQRSEQRNVSVADINDSRDEPVTTRYTLQPQDDEYLTSSIEASYDLGFSTLNYVGGYYWSHNREVIDSTIFAVGFLNGAVPALDADGPGGLPPDPIPERSTFPFATESTIYTSELRLQDEDKSLGINLFGTDITFDYVAGVYYQSEERDGIWLITVPGWNANKGANTVPMLTEGGVVLGAQGGSEYENRAVYGDVTVHLTDKVSVGGGVRFFDQEIHTNQASFGESNTRAANGATVGFDLSNPTQGTPGIKSEDGFTPRATLKYQIDNDRMVYFTAAKGLRLGQGFGNENYPEPDVLPECIDLAKELQVFDDIKNGTESDSVWSYDLGLKSKWMDDRLLTNLSLYYLVWSDYQQTIQMSQYSDTCHTLANANAGEAISKGFELEMEYAPTEHWFFNAAIAYTNAEFSEVPDGVSSSVPSVNLKKGDKLRGVAPWTAAVGAEYRFDAPGFLGSEVSGYVRSDWRYVDERMFNFGDVAIMRADPVRAMYFADAYNITDVRLGLENDVWVVSFYVSNLFNQEVIYEAKRDFFQPNIRAASIGQPRAAGFNVTRRFE